RTRRPRPRDGRLAYYPVHGVSPLRAGGAVAGGATPLPARSRGHLRAPWPRGRSRARRARALPVSPGGGPTVLPHVSDVRGVIFDFDGLILDTESPEFTSWRDISSEHGCVLSLEDWAVCIGTADVFDPCAHLEAQLGRAVDRDALRTERRRRSDALIAAQMPMPGVVERIAEARAIGLKLAVASSSSRSWVEGHLTRLDLARHFHCIRCSDHVEQVKPDPALYRLALQGLGL